MKRFLVAAALSSCLCQPAAADSNISNIQQIGVGHQAAVDQVIDSNSFSLHLGENISTMSQAGANHLATVVQSGFDGRSDSNIQQDGTSHTANVRQFMSVGSDNTSRVEQSGHGHDATVVQILGQAASNVSFIAQTGSGNSALAQQGTSAATSTSIIQQDGSDQSAIVYQSAALFDSLSTVAQTGTGNSALVMQSQANAPQTSRIDVTGDSNYTQVIQGQQGSQTDDGEASHWSDIDILGSGNDARIFQAGGSVANSSSLAVIGDGNTISVSQQALNFPALAPLEDSNTSQIDVIGGSNQIEVDQSITTFRGFAQDIANISEIQAFGDSNLISIDQTIVAEHGNQNKAQLQIDGSSNQITVVQEARQRGIQPSTMNEAIVNSSGNGNVVNVVQN